jgi:hypothetical protein
MLSLIRTLVESGCYEIGQHTLLHMMEEGFDKEHCVGAVMGGRVLEAYPDQNRCLVAGYFHLSARNTCPLHVVCELPGTSGNACVRFVTAYIPRPPQWISPHVRARK